MDLSIRLPTKIFGIFLAQWKSNHCFPWGHSLSALQPALIKGCLFGVGGGGGNVIFHVIALHTIGFHTFAHTLVTMLARLESLLVLNHNCRIEAFIIIYLFIGEDKENGIP